MDGMMKKRYLFGGRWIHGHKAAWSLHIHKVATRPYLQEADMDMFLALGTG